MNRITEKQLQGMCDRLNLVTGSPGKPYIDGKAQIGNFHISHAYGGVCLHRMHNSSGGVSDPLYCGRCCKRELYNRIYSFIEGIELKTGQYSNAMRNIRKTIDGSQPIDIAGALMAIDSMIGGDV